MDYLRAFMIVLVIVMHTALAYLSNWQDWVHNPQPQGLFAIIAIFAESGVLMPIVFFISGYFALSSLGRHGTGEFLKSKFVRLGIPFLIGVLLVSPTLWAMSYYSDGGHLPFIQAISLWFNRGYLGQYHFWYLNVLLVFFIGLALACRWIPGLLKPNPSPRQPTRLFFAGIIAMDAILCFALNLVNHYSTWSIFGLLQVQVVKVPLYITYFILGVYAWKNSWFKGGYQPRLTPWLPIYLVSFLFVLGMALKTVLEPTTILQKAVLNTAASIEVLAALMTCLALFQKLGSAEHPRLSKLSGLSFNAYLVHLSVAFAILYLTRDINLPLLPKYGLQAAGAVLISWAIAYGMSQLSGWRNALAKNNPQRVEEKLQPKPMA